MGVLAQDKWYTIGAYAKLHCNEQERELTLNLGLHSPSKSGISPKHMPSPVPLYNHMFALCVFIYSSICIESIQCAWLRTQ